MVVALNGTARAMTLVVPTKDLNGSVLTILGVSGAAHVITVAGGLGGGTLNTITFDASGTCNVSLIASSELWQLYPSPYAGTLTSCDVTMTHV
jgi:hypothetical protein